MKVSARKEKLQFAQNVEGFPIAVVEQGEGAPIVFCYGATCGRYHWKYQLAFFSKHYRTVVVDYRGHHLAYFPSNFEDLTIRGCASDVLSALDRLGIKKAVFCGHSIGVNVLLSISEMAPERIAGLVLMCGTYRNPFLDMTGADIWQVVFELVKAAYLYMPKTFHLYWKKFLPTRFMEILVASVGYNKALSQRSDIQFYLEGVSKHHPATLLYLLQEMCNFDGLTILKKIENPTLIIGGGRDLLTPITVQRKMHEQVRNSEFFEIPFGSHVVQYDMPELVNVRIEKYLRDIGYN